MNTPKKHKSEEKLNISIEEAIKNISANKKIEATATDEPKQKIFTKFWSMPNGINSDKVWKTQRDQRAESEIIRRQRKNEASEDVGFWDKLKNRHKTSY